jgi:translation initiation factor IF-3
LLHSLESFKETAINQIRLNRDIRAATVRLVGADGSQLGVVSIADALAQAEAAGLDLAEIAPSASPPVAKIIDWGKYKYEQTKQENKSRKRQKTVEIKQVRLGLKIGEHDLQVKLKHAKKFLSEGNKVKVSLRFRGREITHSDLGRAVLVRFMSHIEDIAVIEQPASLAARELIMVIAPRKEGASKQDAKNEDTQGDGQAD